MSTRDLFDLDAGVDSQEEDEDFDEETGEARKPKTNGVNGQMEDSSEEDEDEDDDEAAVREVREGFIDDEDEDMDADERRRRRREKKKRRRNERDAEDLDAEDLDLIGALPSEQPDQPTFKRLKRGHREERARERGVDDIFSDEEDENLYPGPSTSRNALPDEFADFIEEDEPGEGDGEEEDHEVMVGRTKRGLDALRGLDVGLDEAAIEDMREAFGDGTEYNWALDLQEDMDMGEIDPDKPIELKDVFEPSQLEEKKLTEDDNIIRHTDIPERIQLARKGFPKEDLDEQERTARHLEEADFISGIIWPKKRLGSEFLVPFKKAIAHVLGFMNNDNLEVPFIFQNRKDYLIHAASRDPDGEDAEMDAQESDTRAEKLLHQSDLWEIMDQDLKYRAILQKRQAIQKIYENLKGLGLKPDELIEDLLPTSVQTEDLQDMQEYINFQYAAEIKDANLREAMNGQRRARNATSVFERLRAAPGYNVVRGFGVSADTYAKNVLDGAGQNFTDDREERPDDMADQYIDGESFSTGAQLLKNAKTMFAEELAMNPRMRKLFRREYYMNGRIDCFRTQKGLKQIDEDHPYYEFKYLRNKDLPAMARKPEQFLRMLKAESEGLVEVRVHLEDKNNFRRRLQKTLLTDNFAEAADAWNALRREALDIAIYRLDKIIVKGVKENLKTECENEIARNCREEYSKKLDQAPYKVKGMDIGVVPRVLAMSLSRTSPNEVNYVWMEEDARVLEKGTLNLMQLRLGNAEKGLPDGEDVSTLRHILERRKPDLVAISGYTPETRSLSKIVSEIVEKFEILGNEYEDDDDAPSKRDLLDIMIVNDEIARLYCTSQRAETDLPGLTPTTRYCVALCRYIQSPIKEYAALGSDILSITFDLRQNLVPRDKLMKYLETAMIDMVNLVGVEINKAVSDSQYTGALLPYVCGLGPRKATAMVQSINRSSGQLNTRMELLGDPDSSRPSVVGPKVFENCASFLYIEYEATEPGQNYLDNTRVHPEDYDLAKKMAADAMDMDEEDVKGEIDENGEFAVLRKMYKENRQHEVNDLVLELYAEQLESNFAQQKRATLETIRAELAGPYEELRQPFNPLSTDEIFTMLTGETRDSLCEGMVVTVSVRKVFVEHLDVKLDCGIEGGVSEAEFPSGIGATSGTDPKAAFKPHQTLQAKVLYLSRKQLTAQLTLREDAVRRPYKREIEREPGYWDIVQEEDDRRDAVKETETVTGRPQRVIKHPLFRPFNAAQAEEYLGPQNRGDVVIRPSSKGMDHLAVTWKVADNVFQHIDVLELDKENEFSVGHILRIGGKWSYSDLDELVVAHVKSMVKKVEEMVNNEHFQGGSKTQTGKPFFWSIDGTLLILFLEQWLTAYMEANPKRSKYAFCINSQYPGYFNLCFKQTPNSKVISWPVKVIPGAFELQKNPYPDMRALTNGFKTLIMNQAQRSR